MNEQLNMLYDSLKKIELVEMVMKAQNMDLTDIKKVKADIEDQIKKALI